MKNFFQDQFARPLLFLFSSYLLAFIPISSVESTDRSISTGAAVECSVQQIDSEGFESGWGIWVDEGRDAFRYESSYYADRGSYSVLLRDDGVEASITTQVMDLSSYSEVKIRFSFFVVQFEAEEDFWLQVSTDGGNTFQTVDTWQLGVDFSNGERHLEEVSISGPFSDQTHFRFRCDASGNRDYLFLDEIELSGCEENEIAIQKSIQSCTASGEILMERWNDIGNAHQVDQIPLNLPPTGTSTLSSFEIPINAFEEYGVRVRGYICPPQTGNYTFWIASDDNGELWLSSDENPDNKRRIAHVPGWTQSRIWDKYPEQQSEAVFLEQGKSYYVEALMKEGLGGDNLAVKWQQPDGTEDTPIPGAYLSPYVPTANVENCTEGGELVYNMADSFEGGQGAFSYADDVFFGSNSPAYASGQWTQNVGPTGGSSLGVYLGGQDNADISGMSGGWVHTFSLSQDADVSLSFWYNLIMYEGYEPDEYSEVVYAIDGNAQALVRLIGDGNGGFPMRTGWQSINMNLGQLKAGTHTLILGGYNNRKTFNGEQTEVYIDLVELNATSLANTAPKAVFSWDSEAEGASLAINFDASQSTDPEGGSLTYNWDFGNGEQGVGQQAQYTYSQAGTYRVSLSVSDAAGCQTIINEEITVQPLLPTPITVDVIPLDATTCGGNGSVQITASRGEVSLFDADGNTIDKSAWNGLEPGAYTWIVKDGEEEESGRFTLSARYEYPEISQVVGTDLSCRATDGRIEITFPDNPTRSNIEFSIDGGNSFPVNVAVSSGSAAFTNLDAGTYEMKARWGNNECVVDLGTIVLEASLPPIVSLDLAGPFEVTANVQQLVASPLGGTWTGTVSASGIFDPSIGPGLHEVRYTYTDVNGCSASDQILIEVTPVAVTCNASITPVSPIAIGAAPVQLSAVPAGGFWSGSVSADGMFNPGNCPGEFEVFYTYRDGADCFTSDTLIIKVENPVKDVFIYAGQSNAVGAQGAPQYLSVSPEDQDAYIDYAWNIPGEQSSLGWDKLQLLQMDPIRKGHGAEISFARYLFNRGYTNLGMIKFAKGGTNLNYNWNPNTNLTEYDEGTKNGMYPAMRNFVNTQLASLSGKDQNISHRISGFLWHQGEGDMNPTMAPNYKANLLNFVRSLREDFGEDLPVFIASVYNPNATPAEGEAIRLAQREVADGDPRVYIVNLDSIYYDANGDPSPTNVGQDKLHYNSSGLVKIGNAFGRMVKTLNPSEGCEDGLGTLCDFPENLAYQRSASQSSTYGMGTADLAVDGNIIGTSPWTPDLAHTQKELQPWWQVDLGGSSTIEQVRIFNRNDCCAGRLNNFSIFVSEEPFPGNATLTSLQNDPRVAWIPFTGE
ncbi:MAG: sialate O-acetylesterase, partial [Bacteroidota bacterium]